MQIRPSPLRRALYIRREKHRRGVMYNLCFFSVSFLSLFFFFFLSSDFNIRERIKKRCSCDSALEIAVLLKRRLRYAIIR